MKFKDLQSQNEFDSIPSKLKEIALFFDKLSNDLGIEAVVTRIKTKICGDSGVHMAGRAIDFRNETLLDDGTPHYLYTDDQVKHIVDSINSTYPRDDGKLVVIHHSFQGAPWHFHLQCPFAWLTRDEAKKITEGMK